MKKDISVAGVTFDTSEGTFGFLASHSFQIRPPIESIRKNEY